MEMIPVIDLRLLTQSEITTLALSSSAAADPRRHEDDVIVPKIDRSVFNESAGSRKQTYSRLRLAPPKPNSTTTNPSSRRRGRPRSTPLPPAPSPNPTDNLHIVRFLRHLFPDPSDPGPRKRGRKKRKRSPETGTALLTSSDANVLNGRGEAVDLVGLASKEEFFREEFRRRTVGLVTEAEFLGFMNELDGEWGSRRKRRKIVNAACFGDVLPKGWKLILGLKRKEGAVWLHCRRYISPSGKQLMSCREVSAYLLSLVGSEGATSSIHDAGISNHTGNTMDTLGSVGCSSGHASSLPADSDKEVVVPSVEKHVMANPLECRKSDLKFSDKAADIDHLLELHQGGGKHNMVGKSISSGVIIKDGMYECQFCHKTFTERHRYNGHVGIHVRNYPQSLEILADNIRSEEGLEPNLSNELPTTVPCTDSAGAAYLEKTVEAPSNGKPLCDGNTFASCSNSFNRNEGSNGGPDNTAPETSTDVTSEKLIDNSVCKSKSSGAEWSSLVESADVKSSTFSGSVSIVKETLPKNPSKMESTVETSNDNNASQVNVSCCVNEKHRNEPLAAGSSDPVFGTSVQKNYDPTCGESQVHSSTTIGISTETKNAVEENSGDASKTRNPTDACESHSEIAHVAKCHQNETVKNSTGSVLGQINKYNLADGNSRCGTKSDAEAFVSCTRDVEVCITLERTKVNVDGNCYGKKANKLINAQNSQSDACMDSDIKSEVSPMKTNYEHQPPKEPNSTPISSLGIANSSSNFIESALAETTVVEEPMRNTDRHQMDPECDLNNFSCDWHASAETGLFAFREINEIENSLCDQQLFFEREISMSTADQSYSAPTNAAGMLIGQPEKHELAETGNYGKQDCVNDLSQDGRSLGSQTQIDNMCSNNDRESCSGLDIDLEFGLSGSNKGTMVEETSGIGVGALEEGLLNSSSLWLQPSSCFPTDNTITEQGFEKFYGSQQQQEFAPGFDDLRLDGFEPSITLPGQDSGLSPTSMSLSYDAGLENVFVPPGQLEWGLSTPAPGMISSQEQVTTVCMWCGVQFSQEGISLQPQSDSIGFICPTCKTKFSGQLKF